MTSTLGGNSALLSNKPLSNHPLPSQTWQIMSSSSSTLLSLSADVLSLLTAYLAGWDILCLWRCGSPTLNYRLGDLGGVRRLSVTHPWSLVPVVNCPAFIAYFKKLDQLELNITLSYSTVDQANTLLSGCSKSLRTLLLPFTLFRDQQGLVLQDHFPLLESLTIPRAKEENNNMKPHRVNLPTNLRLLTLETRVLNLSTPLPSILQGDLQHLHISSMADWDDLYMPQLASMPLQTLRLPRLNFSIEQLKTLPRTLTSLEFELYGGDTINAVASALPRGIAVLRLTREDIFPCAVDEPKPLGLDSLTALELGDGRFEVHAASLPGGLKSLRLKDVAGNLSDLLPLPPNLQELSLRDIWSDIPANFVANLPRGLEKLELSLRILDHNYSVTLLPKDLPFLPPHLTHLVAWSTDLKPGDLAQLPRSLTHLEIRINHGTQPIGLVGVPPLLRSIILGEQLSADGIPLLPRGIEACTFFVSSNQSFELHACLPLFPPNITQLSLTPSKTLANAYRLLRLPRIAAEYI